MIGKIENLYRYPVKGLSAQALDSVMLSKGFCFPADRIVAIARGDGAYNENDPTKWIDKGNFFVLREEARLANLETRYEPETDSLVIKVAGHQVLSANLSTIDGQNAIVEFYALMFEQNKNSSPKIARAEPYRFTDVDPDQISIINLASVRDFENKTGQKIDPLRFRANIHIEGWPAWEEKSLDKGTIITVGNVKFSKSWDTGRCAATEVDPKTGKRDLRVPQLLMQHYDHSDFGIYVQVVEGGSIGKLDKISA